MVVQGNKRGADKFGEWIGLLSGMQRVELPVQLSK